MILAISGSLSVFEIPYVITDGGFGTSTYFVLMDKLAHANQKVGLASAMAVVLLILLVSAVQKLAEKKLDSGIRTSKRRARK
jgi:ABC-type sugar transport system permease subunit